MRIVLILMLLSAVSGGPWFSGHADTAQAPRRMLEPSEQRDWLAVGRLNVSGQGFCTATLIAADLALTAAHCLLDKQSGLKVRAERVHFLPGFRRGAFAAHARATQIALLPGYSRETRSVGRDLGLVRLSGPVVDTIVPILPGGPVERGQVLSTLSYGIDRAHIASLETPCLLRRQSDAILYTSCEGVAGVSGAPVLISTPQGPRIVAVASAVRRVSGNFAKGSLLAVSVSDATLKTLIAALGASETAVAEKVE